MKTEYSLHSRNCPKCNKEIYYSHKWVLDRAIKANSQCKSCVHSGDRNHMFGKSGENHHLWGTKREPAMLGKKHTEEAKIKISEDRKKKGYRSFLGKTHTEESKQKISQKALNRTEEQIQRYREVRCKKIMELGGNRSFNPKACEIFDKINKELQLNGKHAKNGSEEIKFGYFLDFYDEENKICIEWDEYGHFHATSRVERDIKKHNNLCNKLPKDWTIVRWNEPESTWRTDLYQSNNDKLLNDIKTIILEESN